MFTATQGSNGEEWSNVWAASDKGNRGVANVGSIIKLWEKY